MSLRQSASLLPTWSARSESFPITTKRRRKRPQLRRLIFLLTLGLVLFQLLVCFWFFAIVDDGQAEEQQEKVPQVEEATTTIATAQKGEDPMLKKEQELKRMREVLTIRRKQAKLREGGERNHDEMLLPFAGKEEEDKVEWDSALWREDEFRLERPGKYALPPKVSAMCSKAMLDRSSVCQRGKRSQLAKDHNDFQPLSIADAKEFSYAPFLLDVPSFLHPHHRQYWLELPEVQQLIRLSSSCPSSICHLLTTPEAEGDRERGEGRDSAFLLTFDPNSYRKIAFWSQNYTRGEVTVVKNGVWRQDRPKLRWKSNDLCDWNADWRWIVTSTEEEEKEHKKKVAIKRKSKHVNRLILTATPESWSFQHWLDGLFPKLIQAWPWFRDGTWDVLGEGRMQPTTQKLWNTIGLHVPPSTAAPNYDSILQEQQTVILVEDTTTIFTANEMLFPCVAPVYHPYLWHRMQHELLISHQYEAEEKGEEEDEGEGDRNVILYMSRGSEEDDEEEKGEEEVERKRTLKKMTRNKERTISNEKELLQSIQQALLDRNLSEQLVLFDDLFSSLSSSSLSKLYNFLQKRVKALIGPHGGAFYNMRFCRRGTFIVELLPKSRPVLTFWWEARLGGHRYWLLPVESDKEKGHQMKANVSDIYQLLRYHLF